MSQFNFDPNNGGKGGPPALDLLCISLAVLAAILGTPAVFQIVGPIIEELVEDAYGSEDLANLMYIASFGLSGIAIFCVCRITLFYAVSGVIAFGTMRFAGLAV